MKKDRIAGIAITVILIITSIVLGMYMDSSYIGLEYFGVDLTNVIRYGIRTVIVLLVAFTAYSKYKEKTR